MTTQRPGIVTALENIEHRMGGLTESVTALIASIAATKKLDRTQRVKDLWIAAVVVAAIVISLAAAGVSAVSQTRLTSEITQGRVARLTSTYDNCQAINSSNSVIADLVTVALTPAKAPAGLSPVALRAFTATQAVSRARAQAFAALVKARTKPRVCVQ